MLAFTAMLQVTGHIIADINRTRPGIAPNTDHEGFNKAVYPDQCLSSVIAPAHYPVSGKVSRTVAALCNLLPLESAAGCFMSDFECERELPSWRLFLYLICGVYIAPPWVNCGPN